MLIRTRTSRALKNVIVKNENITWVKNVNSQWASFGLVNAVLNAMQAVKNSNIQFHRIILLSGQDYPVKSNAYINEFLKQSSFSTFLEYYQIPNEKWQPKGGLYRVNKYYIGQDFLQKYLAKALNLLANFIKPLQRKLPGNVKPYAGSQWWIIDDYALNYILSFIKNNPRYTAFHRYTFAPDEVFFHTILLNAKDEKIQNNISRDNKRFYRWFNASNAHPDILTKDDFESIFNSDALFARKFDATVDEEILNSIDENCLQQKSIYAAQV